MSDTTGATATPPATPTTAVTPASAPATPPPATVNEDDGEKVYRTQEQFDRALGARLERERTKLATEHEAKLKTAREEGKTEALTSFQVKDVQRSTETIAKELKFHDPKDALAAIDSAKLPLTDKGEADDAAIKVALEALAKSKPYLVSDENPKRPAPNTRPKLPDGNPDPNANSGGKRSASEALRELAARRKGN